MEPGYHRSSNLQGCPHGGCPRECIFYKWDGNDCTNHGNVYACPIIPTSVLLELEEHGHLTFTPYYLTGYEPQLESIKQARMAAKNNWLPLDEALVQMQQTAVSPWSH
jgi:hypothetical protein